MEKMLELVNKMVLVQESLLELASLHILRVQRKKELEKDRLQEQ